MGDVQGKSYMRGLAVYNSFYRAYTIHGTSTVTLSSSVAYDVMGHAMYMEDGVEEDCTIEYNLIAHVHAINPLARPHKAYDDIEDADADNQWIQSTYERTQPAD